MWYIKKSGDRQSYCSRRPHASNAEAQEREALTSLKTLQEKYVFCKISYHTISMKIKKLMEQYNIKYIQYNII
jgi:hypothetical protein